MFARHYKISNTDDNIDVAVALRTPATAELSLLNSAVSIKANGELLNVVKIMAVTSAIQIAVGLLAFYHLASLDGIEKYKLFSLFGLFLNICGVLLLSELVITASAKRSHAFDYLYAFIWAGLFNIPIGMVLGSLILFWLDLPSAGVVLAFAAGILAYVATPLFISDYAGEIFKLRFYRSVTERVVFMGWYLLLAGMILQLVGGVLDLIS